MGHVRHLAWRRVTLFCVLACSECNGRVWRIDVGMSSGMFNAPPQVREPKCSRGHRCAPLRAASPIHQYPTRPPCDEVGGYLQFVCCIVYFVQSPFHCFLHKIVPSLLTVLPSHSSTYCRSLTPSSSLLTLLMAVFFDHCRLLLPSFSVFDSQPPFLCALLSCVCVCVCVSCARTSLVAQVLEIDGESVQVLGTRERASSIYL